MRNYLEQLGLSEASVRARIDFLADRAARVHRAMAYHDEGNSRQWRHAALLGAAGSCSTEAAGLAFLAGIDPFEHLEQAVRDYSNAGLPFGLFLQTLSKDTE
jgi:hypothetical protein